MPVFSHVLKYSFGQFWNMKFVYRMGRTYLSGWPIMMPRSANCPRCHQPDSGEHILGGCGHTIMRALNISRHDEAMRKVLQAINQGQKGSYLKIVDIGPDELINDLGVISKRIPTCLIPDDTLPQVDLSAHQRHVLRPLADIMLIEVNHWLLLGGASTICYTRASCTSQWQHSRWRLDQHGTNLLKTNLCPGLQKGCAKPG